MAAADTTRFGEAAGNNYVAIVEAKTAKPIMNASTTIAAFHPGRVGATFLAEESAVGLVSMTSLLPILVF